LYTAEEYSSKLHTFKVKDARVESALFDHVRGMVHSVRPDVLIRRSKTWQSLLGCNARIHRKEWDTGGEGKRRGKYWTDEFKTPADTPYIASMTALAEGLDFMYPHSRSVKNADELELLVNFHTREP
jgi:hypothetical protein